MVGADQFQPRRDGQTRPCEEGERDWLFICQLRYEVTPAGLKDGRKAPAGMRIGVTSMGTYQGEPILVGRELPQEGPVLSQEAQKAWEENVVMPQHRAAAGAYAAKSRERLNRPPGK